MSEITFITNNKDIKDNTTALFDLYTKTNRWITPEEKQALNQQALQIIDKDLDLHAREGVQKNTLLGLLSLFGNIEGVKRLIAMGADIHAREWFGNTPLYNAALGDSAGCLVALMNAGADLNSTLNDSGQTPLHAAAMGNSVSCLPLLLAKGADPHAIDQSGNNLLHLSAQCPNDAFLKEALKLGLSIHTANKEGVTPLHRAAYTGGLSCVKTLLAEGADIHRRDNEGDTPLLACIASEAADILIHLGADVNAQNYEGETTLHQASRYVTTDVMQALIAEGAYVNIKDHNGDTPLLEMFLNQENFEGEEKILLDAGASVWAASPYWAELVLCEREELKPYIKKWSKKLERGDHPETKEDVLHLVSVMRVGNNTSIPEPRAMAEQLFRTLPYTEPLNKLYKEYTGQDRPLEITTNLQTMRARARNSGVGL